MRSYVNRNKRTINKAFRVMQKGVDATCREGMTDLLEKGVRYCLDAHDSQHQHHLETGDSYGWSLVRNGAELKRKIYAEGGDAIGNASSALDEVVRHGSLPSGYVGIVLAGMHPVHYFAVRFEFYAMRKGMGQLSSEAFNKYFKPVVL